MTEQILLPLLPSSPSFREKRCSRCRLSKPLNEFYVRHTGKNAGIYFAECIMCARQEKRKYYAKHRIRLLAAHKSYRNSPAGKATQTRYRERQRQRPDKAIFYRRHKLKFKYGLTLDDFNALVAKQNGLCAICKQPPDNRGLVVDHCHETGKVRGLLCDKHNRSLGYFGDTVEAFQSVIKYLQGNY